MFDSKKEVATSPTSSSEPARPDPDDEAGISPHPRPGRRDDGTSAAAAAEATSKGDDAGRDRSMNKIVEGLRGDAFLIARDLGFETLTQDGGLERLVERIKSHVFPRALGLKKKPP